MRGLLAVPALVIALIAVAHNDEPGPLVSVYATDPANPQISYDSDPYVRAPWVPDNPTVVYPESQAGALAGITDPYTALQPRVVNGGDPDTYSTPAPAVYSTPPPNIPGPYFSSGVPMRFDFGPGPVATGYTQVTRSTAYGPSTGYGWGDTSKVDQRDRGGSDPLQRDFCLVNGTPFYVDIPDGRYRVTCVVGDAIGQSGTSVRANGLYELASIGAPSGQWATASFPIAVKGGRLRFEFLGTINHINGLTIEPIPDSEWNKTTVFLASDSTVASYAPGFYLMGWGQPLHNFFTTNVVVDNQAKAGRSSRSFLEEGSLDTILNRIKPGDCLFIMFAINDSADTLPGEPNYRKTSPATTFKAYLRKYVTATQTNGAIPVFVTAQIKCTYNAWGQFNNSVQGYPQAMRELAAELNVPLLELNRTSIDHLTAVGVPEARSWYATNPSGGFDYIHLSAYGATNYARLVSQLVLQTKGLEKLAQEVVGPARPQPGFIARSAY